MGLVEKTACFETDKSITVHGKCRKLFKSSRPEADLKWCSMASGRESLTIWRIESVREQSGKAQKQLTLYTFEAMTQSWCRAPRVQGQVLAHIKVKAKWQHYFSTAQGLSMSPMWTLNVRKLARNISCSQRKDSLDKSSYSQVGSGKNDFIKM